MCPGSLSGHAITANDNWSLNQQVNKCKRGPTTSWACVDKAIHMLQEAQTILYMCTLKKNSGKSYNKNKPYISHIDYKCLWLILLNADLI